MANLASFWVGDRLGPIEIASAQSFLRHGDNLTIYSYTPVADVPAGVRVADAATVMPTTRVIRHHKNGSPAIHSDLFRYALLAQTDQIWVDLDIIALRSFNGAGDWLFGYETDTEVNNAVLRLPRDSKTLQKLKTLRVDTVGLPDMLTGMRRFKYWLKSGGRGLSIDRWPWGATGPRALTHYLRESGEIVHALPQSAFYAIPLSYAGRFVAPGAVTRDTLPADAWAAHLWGKELRQYLQKHHKGIVPQRSFLDLAMRGLL